MPTVPPQLSRYPRIDFGMIEERNRLQFAAKFIGKQFVHLELDDLINIDLGKVMQSVRWPFPHYMIRPQYLMLQ